MSMFSSDDFARIVLTPILCWLAAIAFVAFVCGGLLVWFLT